MARTCIKCNKKLGFFYTKNLCEDCIKEIEKNKQEKTEEIRKQLPKNYKELIYIKGTEHIENFMIEKDPIANYKKELLECYNKYVNTYDDWEKIQKPFNSDSDFIKNMLSIFEDSIAIKKISNSFIDDEVMSNLDKYGTKIAYALRDVEKEKVFYAWADNNNLNLLDKDIFGIGLITMPLRDILCFSRRGDFYNETNITGGGGGGSSLVGAAIGGVIAGGTGAVIGSRKKVNEIKTENKLVDERQTILELNINSNKEYMFFNSESYNVLLELIPSKEINFINKINITKENTNENDVFESLKKFAQLKDEGILTEEEFQAKKKQLLNI